MKTYLPSEVKDDFAAKLDQAAAGKPFLIHRGEKLLLVSLYEPGLPEVEDATLKRAAAKIDAEIESDRKIGRLKPWKGLSAWRSQNR